MDKVTQRKLANRKEEKSKISLRARLIELFSLSIKSDTKTDVYNFDEDNLYPNRLERVINNSPTGVRCADLMTKFIIGDGVDNDFIINDKKNLTLNDLLEKITRNLVYFNGCYIHVSYGLDTSANLIIKNLDVISYKKCRISKEDDEDYQGKIVYADWEKDNNKDLFSKKGNKKKWFYPYNPNTDVILDQIKKDSKNADDINTAISMYRGQVLYFNNTPQHIYALPKADSIYNDLDTEYRFSLYVNRQFRTGFLGKTAVLTNINDEEIQEEVDKQLKDFLGSENSSNIWHLCIPGVDYEYLEKSVIFKQLQAQFDDKLFINTENRLRRNILGIFNNIPEGLVYGSKDGLIGDSGAKYQEMVKFYSNQCRYERKAIERLMFKFGLEIEIKEFETENIENENTEEDEQSI